MARPRIDFDKEQFEKLCRLLPTKAEIASYFDMSEQTLIRRLKEEYGEGFEPLLKRFGESTKLSLRRQQIKAAEKGNTSMLIWLGKTLLGQKETETIEIKPIELAYDPNKPKDE